MARTKRKPMQLETPPPPRPLWSKGLTLGDINHISYLADTGMDRLRVPLEHSATASINRTQSVAGLENISATAQATAAPEVLPEAQEEEALVEDHVHEDDALIFNFETAPSNIEQNQSANSISLQCRSCNSTFGRNHELVAHVWQEHMQQELMDWLPGPVYREQEKLVQELVENLGGVSSPGFTRLTPERGPPPATRTLLSARRAPIDTPAAGPSTTHHGSHVSVPTQPVAAVSAGAFPPGALEMHQPFRLDQQVPLGVKVPTDASLTSFKWEVYNRRAKTPFDWNSRKSVRLANHWRSRTTQGALKRLGVKVDRRKKSTAPTSAADHDDEGEEGEEDGENGEDEEGQDDEKMDTGE